MQQKTCEKYRFPNILYSPAKTTSFLNSPLSNTPNTPSPPSDPASPPFNLPSREFDLRFPTLAMSFQTKTLQLSNLHRTTELLQHTIRAIRLSKKLRDLISASAMEPEKLDLAKAAQLHCDILTLCNEYELAGVDVIDEELKWVNEAGEKLRSTAMKVLERGMEGLNEAEVGTGLQVFYKLGDLKATMEQLLNTYKNLGVKSVSIALDMRAMSWSAGGIGPAGVRSSGVPQIGGEAEAREAIWQLMGTTMDKVHSIMVSIWHLQKALSKNKDPSTRASLLVKVIQEGDPLLTDRVWEALVKAFASEMDSACTASSFVEEIFCLGYPKLLSMVENLLKRISHDTHVKGLLPAISLDNKRQMITAIEPFETGFICLCYERMLDLVNSAFGFSSQRDGPSKEQILKIISCIEEEIEAVRGDGHLILLVLREIRDVLIRLAKRAENEISSGPEASQLIFPINGVQFKNLTISQHLQEVHARMSLMISGLPPIASDILSRSLDWIYRVAHDSVTSLFQAMLRRLETCILLIHDQDLGYRDMDAVIDDDAAPYMDSLLNDIGNFGFMFLSRLLSAPIKTREYASETICIKLAKSMASRVLLFFIRHASLIRSLSESGKLRMARDMHKLELAVGRELYPVRQLGAPYRAFRAFQSLIFVETSQLEASPLLQDLPPSIILHHLYSRNPDELQSPMQRNNHTPLQYSLFLDYHRDDEVGEVIAVTLDEYVTKLYDRSYKERVLSPVFPLMITLLDSMRRDYISLLTPARADSITIRPKISPCP